MAISKGLSKSVVNYQLCVTKCLHSRLGVVDLDRLGCRKLALGIHVGSKVSALNRFSTCGIGKLHSNELARGSYPVYLEANGCFLASQD